MSAIPGVQHKAIPTSASKLKRARQLVLMAEDHDDTRELYRYLLESQEFGVVEARDGEEAVRLAQELLPDLILMDTNLPKIDGYTATKAIRTLPALCQVPIIFLSGHSEPQARNTALTAGGDEYLVKPVSPKELETAIENLLGKKGLLQRKGHYAVGNA